MLRPNDAIVRPKAASPRLLRYRQDSSDVTFSISKPKREGCRGFAS